MAAMSEMILSQAIDAIVSRSKSGSKVITEPGVMCTFVLTHSLSDNGDNVLTFDEAHELLKPQERLGRQDNECQLGVRRGGW